MTKAKDLYLLHTQHSHIESVSMKYTSIQNTRESTKKMSSFFSFSFSFLLLFFCFVQFFFSPSVIHPFHLFHSRQKINKHCRFVLLCLYDSPDAFCSSVSVKMKFEAKDTKDRHRRTKRKRRNKKKIPKFVSINNNSQRARDERMASEWSE